MAAQETVFHKIAEALLVDYTSVYYVNTVTNEYYWYSVNPEFHSLQIEQGGKDFFQNVIRDAAQVVYEEDQHIFLEDIQKEKILSAVEKGEMLNIEYRLMINNEPVWHSLRLIRGLEDEGDYLILGVINIDKEHRRREKEKETRRQKDVYDQITSSLTEQYDTLYYINLEDSTYVEISSTDEYKKLNVPATGSDFFAESRRSIRKYVHPDDQEKIISLHYKDAMLANLQNSNSYSIAYRLVVNGQVKHIRHTEILARDKKHIIVCIKNIDAEVAARRAQKESERRSVTYTQIAESLASHYDLIYYINPQTSSYIEFVTHKIYGELEVQEDGDGFFEMAQLNADRVIYPEDRDRLKLFIDKDNLITQLENRRQVAIDYRMVVNGGVPQYTRMTVMWSLDKSHLIMCIRNRDEDVRREKEHLQALKTANEIGKWRSASRVRSMTEKKFPSAL